MVLFGNEITDMKKNGCKDLSKLFNLMPIVRDLEQREILRLHTQREREERETRAVFKYIK